MNELYKRIFYLCEQRGISGTKMCRDTGMQPSILTDLKKGRQSGLSAKNAQKVASYFGVSVAYLLGEEKQKPATSGDGHINMTEQQKEALSLISQLTDQEVSIVLSQLKGILQDRSAPGDPKE